MLTHLDRHYAALLAGSDGVARLQAAWRARSATLGRRVRIDLGADDLVGTAVDITSEGHLVVETLEGERRTVAVGDVVHLRPL
jgi:BirA family biotin operon repressor/biotin-[acetyl-CoA-carboxylase] ligase